MNFAFTNETMEKLFEYLGKDFPSKKLCESKMPPMVILTPEQKKRILAQVDELNTVNYTDKKQLKFRAKVFLADLFTRYFSDYTQKAEKEIPIWLAEMINLMEMPENFIIGIERAVELSGKSREHISRSIKKYFGVTLSEHINDLRTNYAANLLLNTDTPVLDICFECGFMNVSWFYEVFRHKYGMSPKKFRKRYKKV